MFCHRENALDALIAKANEQLRAAGTTVASVSRAVTSQPTPMKTVYAGGYSSRYKLIPQDGIPLVNHADPEDDEAGAYAAAPVGGGKDDAALDASLRAHIQDYPDAPCDCACPFVINNILHDDVISSTRHWRTHFEKQYIVILLLSFLFLVDDLGEGHTHLWYDTLIVSLLGVPYVLMKAVLLFSEYSCLCKVRAVRCCCHPDGCGNCCGLTCTRCPLLDVNQPRWNLTRCEVCDPRLLCCRQPCMCLLVLGCLCCRCPCKQYCCHACCPKKSCCGKNGSCAWRCISTRLPWPSRRRWIVNVICNLLIPLFAVTLAGVCAVFLDEQLEGRVPRFVYLLLEVLTFPGVLFLSETLLQITARRCLALCPPPPPQPPQTPGGSSSKKKRSAEDEDGEHSDTSSDNSQHS